MTTEEKILQAAEDEMLERGFEGARMRSISEKAEINKGLLHYYFKSKEALLIKVFQKTFREIFGSLEEVFQSDAPLFEKVELAVDKYSDFLIKYPRLPLFIITEMNRNPEKHMMRMRKAGVNPPFGSLVAELEENKKSGLIRKDFASEQFIMNMMGLILFPLIAKPMIMFMNDMTQAEYKTLITNRKKEVTAILIKDIKAN
jgi:TetR/AcrR family transcriptional regulator